MTASIEKWPVEIKVVKLLMGNPVWGNELDLYFISGIMNKVQCETIKERLPVLSEFTIDEDKIVMSTLVSHQQLMKIHEEFSRLAREWRGQYYALTNVFVEACKEVFET